MPGGLRTYSPMPVSGPRSVTISVSLGLLSVIPP